MRLKNIQWPSLEGSAFLSLGGFSLLMRFWCGELHPLMSEQTGQTHPLYATDRDQVDALLGHQGDPGPEQLTVAARLVMRYGDFPGADDIKQDIQKVVAGWGLDSKSLNARCREIWASGWKPGQQIESELGSGADVADQDA